MWRLKSVLVRCVIHCSFRLVSSSSGLFGFPIRLVFLHSIFLVKCSNFYKSFLIIVFHLYELWILSSNAIYLSLAVYERMFFSQSKKGESILLISSRQTLLKIGMLLSRQLSLSLPCLFTSYNFLKTFRFELKSHSV